MYVYTQFKKREKQQLREKSIRKKANVLHNNTSRSELLLIYLSKTIKNYFPNLSDQLNLIPDDRSFPFYSMADVIFAAISMFLLKTQSRNSVNENRKKQGFKAAFSKIFNYQMPHMDTVHGIIEKISPEHLEMICLCLVKVIIERKTLHPFRLLSIYHIFSIDGVQIVTFSKKTEGVTTKVSKNGVETYTRSCVQVKITTQNDFSIPVMTEWISTDDGQTKEDCELNAFKRVTRRLKLMFPKLPICLVLDGLYTNDSVFLICQNYDWKFIVTLKDRSLKSLWRTIYRTVIEYIYQPENKLLASPHDESGVISDDKVVPHKLKWNHETLKRDLEWLNALNYKGHIVNWFSCLEFIGDIESPDDICRFVWLTNIKISNQNIIALEKAARYGRAGIEDSFNTEKNRGYAMKHKYARKSFNAARNYLTCMHIAEIINQLVSLSLWFRQHMLENMKSTLKDLWNDAFKDIRHMDTMKIEEASSVMPKTYSYP